MRTALGVTIALWGAFFVVFSRRIARGQYPRSRIAAEEAPHGGAGPHRGTTAVNAALGTAVLVAGVLLATGAV